VSMWCVLPRGSFPTFSPLETYMLERRSAPFFSPFWFFFRGFFLFFILFFQLFFSIVSQISLEASVAFAGGGFSSPPSAFMFLQLSGFTNLQGVSFSFYFSLALATQVACPNYVQASLPRNFPPPPPFRSPLPGGLNMVCQVSCFPPSLPFATMSR